MALYVVRKRNPMRIKPGTFVRSFDHGFEKCLTRTENGRMEIIGYEGVVIPESAIKPFISRVLHRGFDKNG